MHLKDDATTKYKSIWDCFRKIIKAEGIFGLYRGIESKLLQSVLTAAFTFAAKEELYNKTTWLLEFLKIRSMPKPIEIQE
jgi:solute carrier family 25 (peroxisomal adenine nucleotide transporter), member 17